MKCLILLALATVAHGNGAGQFVPVVTPEGFLVDTPEVSAAKAAHLSHHVGFSGVSSASSAPIAAESYPTDNSEVATAKAAHYAERVKAVTAAGLSPDTLYQEYHNTFRSNPFYKSVLAGNTVPSNVAFAPEVVIAYTPEVAAARAAHLSQYAKLADVPSALSFAPGAPITQASSENFVIDTNDVAAAKAAHYNEQVKAVTAAGLSPDTLYQEYHNTFRSNPFYKSVLAGNTVPSTNVAFAPEIVIAYTPEVSAARAAHLSQFAKVAGVPSASSFAPGAPIAQNSQASSDHFVTDTADVAAAKAAHYNEQVKAVTAAGLSPDTLYQEYHNTFRTNPFYKTILVAAPANVAVNPDGFVAYTPEVAAARAEHLYQHAKVLKAHLNSKSN